MSDDRIVRIVCKLREREVVTFGDISCVVFGHQGGGQRVGQVIKSAADRDRCKFPWWRVVFDKSYGLRPKDDEARERLKREGVTFRKNGTVDPRHRHKLEERRP